MGKIDARACLGRRGLNCGSVGRQASARAISRGHLPGPRARSTTSWRSMEESPVARRRCSVALVLDEREEISRGIAAGRSIRCIAAGLGRSPSTVSREVARHGGEARTALLRRTRAPGSGRCASSRVVWPAVPATMARCREAGTGLVARADLGVAQASISWRRRLAGVPRNHLSHFVCPSGIFGPGGACAIRKADHAKQAVWTDHRCDFHPRASRRNRGPCRSRPLGRRSALGGQQLAYGHTGREPFSLRDADQGAGEGHRQRGFCAQQTGAPIARAAAPIIDLGPGQGDGQPQELHHRHRRAGLLLRSAQPVAARQQ